MFYQAPKWQFLIRIDRKGYLANLTKDITKDELILGVSDLESPLAKQLKGAGITPTGVKDACAEAVKRITAKLKG